MPGRRCCSVLPHTLARRGVIRPFFFPLWWTAMFATRHSWTPQPWFTASPHVFRGLAHARDNSYPGTSHFCRSLPRLWETGSSSMCDFCVSGKKANKLREDIRAVDVIASRTCSMFITQSPTMISICLKTYICYLDRTNLRGQQRGAAEGLICNKKGNDKKMTFHFPCSALHTPLLVYSKVGTHSSR